MQQSIQSAVKNIATFGDTDIFPFPVEHHIFRDRPELLETALAELHSHFDERLATNPPDNINTLAPIGYTSFRWATQLDPLWNAYYLALVIEIGSAIEADRIQKSENCVFSYRFIEADVDGRIFDNNVTWHGFLETSAEIAGSYAHVVMCDLSDFYSRVYHHRIENALKWLNQKPDIARRIA